jgi:hypothetical protein
MPISQECLSTIQSAYTNALHELKKYRIWRNKPCLYTNIVVTNARRHLK